MAGRSPTGEPGLDGVEMVSDMSSNEVMLWRAWHRAPASVLDVVEARHRQKVAGRCKERALRRQY
jgi:hypothetical protein